MYPQEPFTGKKVDPQLPDPPPPPPLVVTVITKFCVLLHPLVLVYVATNVSVPALSGMLLI
jgi:hypothetical protein